MKNIYSCCFTGHRPQSFSFGYDEEHPACIKIKQALSEQIYHLANNGVSCFLSGMAQGVDIWAAESVVLLKTTRPNIQLACILPCETQASRWHNSIRDRYYNLLAEADLTHTVSRHFTKDCMRLRNQYMVDHSNFVLSVYNGNPRTGTAQTLRYAQKKGRAISIINPMTAEYTPFTIEV